MVKKPMVKKPIVNAWWLKTVDKGLWVHKLSVKSQARSQRPTTEPSYTVSSNTELSAVALKVKSESERLDNTKGRRTQKKRFSILPLHLLARPRKKRVLPHWGIDAPAEWNPLGQADCCTNSVNWAIRAFDRCAAAIFGDWWVMLSAEPIDVDCR